MTAAYRQFPRPTAPCYQDRSEYLSQGDLLAEVPFGILGPTLDVVEDAEQPIVLQRVALRPGLIVSPTCDFRRPTVAELQAAPALEPYTLQRHIVVALVRPLDEVASGWDEAKRENNLRLMRGYDAHRRYMYLPPSPDDPTGREHVVDFTQLDAVAIPLLLGLPRQQLTRAAAQQLQYKLVLALMSTYTDRSAYDPPLM